MIRPVGLQFERQAERVKHGANGRGLVASNIALTRIRIKREVGAGLLRLCLVVVKIDVSKRRQCEAGAIRTAQLPDARREAAEIRAGFRAQEGASAPPSSTATFQGLSCCALHSSPCFN